MNEIQFVFVLAKDYPPKAR